MKMIILENENLFIILAFFNTYIIIIYNTLKFYLTLFI